MIKLFEFQNDAAATIADRYVRYADDPVLAGSSRSPRTVPFFQALAALTGAGKTAILAKSIAEIAGMSEVTPIVLWLSRGKVVVRQSFANLDAGGRYNNLLNGARVAPLGDYSPTDVRDSLSTLVYFATVGTFNQRDKEDSSLTIFKSDVDNTETSTWEALKLRLSADGDRRPLIVVYDEAHNLSDQQTELLMELDPDAFLLASATMRLNPRLATELELLKRAGWSDRDLTTQVASTSVVGAGLVKSTVVLGGYNAPLEETISALLADMGEAEVDAKNLDLAFTPKAIYVCNTNIVAENEYQPDDPKQPFVHRQAPPIRIWRYLVEVCGVDPQTVAVYADLKTHRDAPLPDDFILFRGGENDYERFTSGNYRHVIFNLSLQEGWDDPDVYFAYVDKSMSSRVQVAQVIGRVLRQPGAARYGTDRLNSAHFYVRVDRNEAFNEVLQEVSDRLGADLPNVRIMASAPGRPKPSEILPKSYREVAQTGIQNVDAKEAVREVLQSLPDYRDDSRNVEGQGSRRIFRQEVGSSSQEGAWETFKQSSHVSLRWIFIREIRRRFSATLDVLNLADPRLDAVVGVGSPAFNSVVLIAEKVVQAYVDNVTLKQRKPNPYVVRGQLVRPDEQVEFKNALHSSYSGMNPLELDFARAIDRTGLTWCRNPAKTGYGIPLVTVGSTDNFYPDFLVWTPKRVICLDTKGPHLVSETAARKLLNIARHPKVELGLQIQFVSKGRWDRQLQSIDLSDGFTYWGSSPDGGFRVRPFEDLEGLVAHMAVDPDDDAD